MSNILTYKGYEAKLEYDADDKNFYGIVTNIPDTIHFEGRSVDELQTEFEASVEAYLAHCEKIGKEPNRPYSGKFVLRVSPELHRHLTESARESNESLNAYATRILESSTGPHAD